MTVRCPRLSRQRAPARWLQGCRWHSAGGTLKVVVGVVNYRQPPRASKRPSAGSRVCCRELPRSAAAFPKAGADAAPPVCNLRAADTRRHSAGPRPRRERAEVQARACASSPYNLHKTKLQLGHTRAARVATWPRSSTSPPLPRSGPRPTHINAIAAKTATGQLEDSSGQLRTARQLQDSKKDS